MSITASEARRNLFGLIEQANADRTPIEITSKRGNVVMIAEDDWHSIEETLYLMRSPENARRLTASIEDLEHGRGVIRKTLAELRAMEPPE
jgi:antitoxin YefM